MSGFKWSLQNGDLAAVKGVIEGVRITDLIHHHNEIMMMNIYIRYIDTYIPINPNHSCTLIKLHYMIHDDSTCIYKTSNINVFFLVLAFFLRSKVSTEII